jgi:uncharacterized membrane protein YdjX (TVP38/TMEM64 family)
LDEIVDRNTHFLATAKGRLILTVVFIILLYAVFELTGLRAKLSLDYLQSSFERHWLLGSLIFVLLFSLGNLIQVPGWLFLAASVITLGRVNGGLVTYLAAVVSCCITFGVVFLIGGNSLAQLNSRLANKLLIHLNNHPIRIMFVLRLIFQTAPPLNYTLALSGIKFRQYFIAMILGLPLPITVYCLFFDYLEQLIIT